MVYTPKNNDHPKKEKKKKKQKRKSSTDETTMTMTSTTATTTTTTTDQEQSTQTIPPSENLLMKKNLILQKSKTLMDFRRKSKTIDKSSSIPDSSVFRLEWNQLSFRKKINRFIQNSPLLTRGNYLKNTQSLKSNLNFLSDSLESLKIDENKILNTPTNPIPFDLSKPSFSMFENQKVKMLKKFKSKRGDDRDDSVRICWKCMEAEEVGEEKTINKKSSSLLLLSGLKKGGSLWNLSPLSLDKITGKKIIKRSESLQLSSSTSSSSGFWSKIPVSIYMKFFF
ncbi:hypothetical protein Phum_PHUM155220 [Pediculus humanus corporis]|uniref:Uncharacterized protein n=1 Tax=Pediculus humanus subsp. corporis TaxID=121224 RepID=E0VFD7_PEDHC|nr:uncharacterized protein Phum_PHUM155220 [Pediculus humanus corporis]EEB12093.1 hypothetical protein Phum_PHUM155220 [Pediculus humanus corporis]